MHSVFPAPLLLFFREDEYFDDFDHKVHTQRKEKIRSGMNGYYQCPADNGDPGEPQQEIRDFLTVDPDIVVVVVGRDLEADAPASPRSSPT